MINLRVLVFQRAVDAAAEAPGDGLVVNEEFVFGGMMEGLVFGVEGGSGNDEVNVGMVLDLAAPGVQHAGEAGAGAIVLGGGDVLESVCALAQEQWINYFGMELAEDAEFRGKGEGNHEVGHGQKPRFLFGRPDLLVECAALRA